MAVIPRRIYRTVEWHLHNVPSALAEGDALSESLREAILSQQPPSGITLSGGHGGGHSSIRQRTREWAAMPRDLRERMDRARRLYADESCGLVRRLETRYDEHREQYGESGRRLMAMCQETPCLTGGEGLEEVV